MAMDGSTLSSGPLALDATELMCYSCFDALLSVLQVLGGKSRTPVCILHSPADPSVFSVPDVECPLFVTWKKSDYSTLQDMGGADASVGSGLISRFLKSSHARSSTTVNAEPQLRGCIGTFSALPLQSGLREYALTSALRDRRFDPISASELEFLHCTVSLLTNFEPAKDVYDWQVGTHGILIDFTGPDGHHYHATYLPEVASEQGWTKQDTVASLVRKAGYRGGIDTSLLAAIEVTRYQSKKRTATYAQYLQWAARTDATRNDAIADSPSTAASITESPVNSAPETAASSNHSKRYKR